MILKDKTPLNAVSPTAKAGQKQEQDVAFFLRRAFKDHKKVFVINDFKFCHNGETAQIDHLILYPYGFLLIESKSIKGEVKVNSLGEWTRSINNTWSGMASPIKQVELQQDLLKEMFKAHRELILGKLLGIKQQGFKMRCWDNVCAVSSNAVIDRDSMPKDISKQLVKSEFLVDKLIEVMNIKNKFVRTFTVDSRPYFSNEELESITSFLIAQIQSPNSVEKEVTPKASIKETLSINSVLQCKACGERNDFSPQNGRYGYFIKCNKCDANTAMRTPCFSCKSNKTKVSKREKRYTHSCNDCNQETVLLS